MPRLAAAAATAAGLVWCCEGAGHEDGWTRPGAPLDKLYDLVFTDLKSAEPCVTLSDMHGPTGCATAIDETAPLYLIHDDATFDKYRSDPPSGSWTVVLDLPPEEVLPKLQAIATLAHTKGAFVRQQTAEAVSAADPSLGSFNGAPRKPNFEVDVYGENQSTWNPQGTDTAFLRYNGMALLLSDREFDHVSQAARHNKDNSYHSPHRSVQYNYPMGSSNQTAPTCLLGRTCEPVGSNSVWGSVRPMNTFNKTAQQKYVMLAVPITATSLFHNSQAPGATVVGGAMSTVIATLEMLAKASERGTAKIHEDWQVVYGFFVGEEYGSMGSRRWVDDVYKLKCQALPWNSSKRAGYYCYNPPVAYPNITDLDLESFQHVIAVDQVGLQEEGVESGVWVHWDDPQLRGQAFDSSASGALRDALVASGATNVTDPAFAGRLPPSPAHSFLAHPVMQNRSDLAAAVLAGYPGPWTNRYVGSIYDTARLQSSKPRLNATLVARAATVLAETVWKIVRASPTDELGVTANLSHVEELVSCLGEDRTCDLMMSFSPVSQIQSRRASCPQPCRPYYYPGVIGVWNSLMLHSQWVHQYMVKMFNTLHGNRSLACNTSSIGRTCPDEIAQTYCVVNTGYTPLDEPTVGGPYNGQCLHGAVFYHAAYSPGIYHSTGNSSGRWFVAASDPLPVAVWTESNWATKMGSRIYTADSDAHEAALLVSGVLTTALSFLALLSFNRWVLPKLKTD